ncbi:hypothetical protein [Calidifontibacter indicus]|uniref:hypothetical protein n=1 Tax=Calidifontibacter indicus TaxID=419650 RepID=UPI003D751EF1
MTPRLDDIRRDDDWLDALGSRRDVDGDEAIKLLAQWVDAIDHVPASAQTHPAAAQTGRYARRGLSLTGVRRVASVSGIAIAAISVSSVAAAVSGTSVPGFRELGTVTRGLVGNSGLPQSTNASGLAGDLATSSSTSRVGSTSSGDRPFSSANSSDSAQGTSERSDRTSRERDGSASPSDDSTRVSTRSTNQWIWTGTRWVPAPHSTSDATTRGTGSVPSSTRSATPPAATGTTKDNASSTKSTKTPSDPTTTRTTTRTTTPTTSDPSSTKPTTTPRATTDASTSTTTHRARPTNTNRPTQTPSRTGKPSSSTLGAGSVTASVSSGITSTDSTAAAAPTLPLPPGTSLPGTTEAAQTDQG